MYYRRKYILALIQEFGGSLDNLNFQKLLFLASRKQEKKVFFGGVLSVSTKGDVVCVVRV